MIDPEYIGFFAAMLTTSAFLPQAFKIWKSKKADGLSLTMYLVMGTGTLSWLAYGLLIKSPSVIVAYSYLLYIFCLTIGICSVDKTKSRDYVPVSIFELNKSDIPSVYKYVHRGGPQQDTKSRKP